jgi:two-component system cell cycle response regulator CtrA
MRVLLIEDDQKTANGIELMLRREDVTVYFADLGGDGINLGKMYDYDIIVLDLQLPDMSGFEVLKALRLAKVQTPVLVLSGNAIIEAKVRAFGFGADDYLTKPFHRDELVARIEAVIRRGKGRGQSAITIGKFSVNLDTKTVEVDGRRVQLTRKEYEILELLTLRKGTILTKDMLITHLYHGLDQPIAKIIDVFICKIRKKLADATGGEIYISTIWGCGYRLAEPDDGNMAVASVAEAVGSVANAC